MKKYLLLEMITVLFLFSIHDLIAQTLNVNPSLQIVQDKAGQTIFIITSDINWTVSDNANWLTVNPTSGFGNDTLIATFQKNDGSQPRNAIIEVTGSGITRTVTVTQLKKNASKILTIQPLNIIVGDTAGSTTFAVTSNLTWMVSDDADWLTVTPEFGIYDMTITATYEENTATTQRVGTITVTGGGITKTVTVTQSAAVILTVTPSNQSVTNASGSTEFTVESNTSWTVSDDAEWLTVNPVSDTGNGTLTATYQENTTTSQRVGTITVTDGGITRTVTVTQSATAFTLTVTPQNQSVTNASGSTEFTVQSNTNWTVSDDAGWLTLNPTSGNNNQTLTATYTENTTTAQRIGTITVTGGGITRTVTVTQSATAFTLTVTPQNQSVTNAPGSTAFTVESNTSWTLSDDAAWLSVSPTSGNNNQTLTATYTENTTTAQRIGTITVTGGGITRTVTVTQSATAFTLTVTPSNQSVTNAPGSTEFTVQSNTNWTLSDDAAWLTVSPTSGNNNQTLTATYTENTTTAQRIGTITVTGGRITRTVTVTQSATAFTLTVTPQNQSVTNAPGSTEFTVQSNTSWTLSDDADWLTVSPTSGNNNQTLTAAYTENTTTAQRIGTITVTGGGITRTVTVTQSATAFTLTVTPSNQSVTNSSGSTSFTVESNTSWTLSDDAAWLTVNPMSGNNNQTLTATYTENTTTAQRIGTITVTGGGITRTVTVTQSATAFTLNVTPQNQSVTNAPGSTEFTVQSNTSWTLSDDADWLTVSPTSGNNNQTLTATYTENTTTAQRIGTITVTGGGITRTVTITQGESLIELNHVYSFSDPYTTNNYQMIGLPGANNILLSSVITGLPGQEGDWRAFWDSGILPLIEYNGDDNFYFRPGKAFWIISRYPIYINISAPPVPLSEDSTFSIRIHHGWNLISNPFDTVLTWSSINNANGGNLQPIYSYQSNSYSNALDFEPYKGYYFFCSDSLTSLKIPYHLENDLNKKNSNNKKELEIVLALNGVLRTAISAGIAENARTGVDIFDIFSPPSLFNDVNISLYNDKIETDYKYLQKEFRPEIGDGQEFDILVKNTSNETLELDTKGAENFSEYEVYLLDKGLMKLYDLRNQNKIEIQKKTSGKEYILYIGTEEYIDQKKSNLIPLEYILYQNYPNPFNPKTNIMFALPQQGKVSLMIYNILGELIEEKINDQLYEAGYHQVSIDFGNLASGIYFYKLQINFSGKQSFTETKKMMLMK
ncbi:MAG TPA: hypothetical protein DHV28_04515 [Ignavibacteriales bacterium]|nr:hypothetical protein [Ignavibacteriales bacterium]